MQNLKSKAIWSGVARLFNQIANLLLRLGYLAIPARLLSPSDFGLVAMVAVVTGAFELFTTAGRSSAAVQKDSISVQQISALFWVNILVGTALALLCGQRLLDRGLLPEPRLFWITVAMAPGFSV
jgi:O-antigen/teichoic acid export membrane protein